MRTRVVDNSASSSGSDGRHVARRRHSRSPASLVPASGHSPRGVSPPELLISGRTATAAVSSSSAAMISSELAVFVAASSSVGRQPSRVLTTSRRRRSSARTASVVVVAPTAPYKPPKPLAYRALGHPPLSHAGSNATATLSSTAVSIVSTAVCTHARRLKSAGGPSHRLVIAVAHAARIAPQSATRRSHFKSFSAILASASRLAPAAGGRCGPRARALDSSASNVRSSTTPSIASETSRAIPSGNVLVLFVASSEESSESFARLCVIGLCASQHPCALHDSRSPQSHTPPVSLRYMM